MAMTTEQTIARLRERAARYQARFDAMPEQLNGDIEILAAAVHQASAEALTLAADAIEAEHNSGFVPVDLGSN